jgi:PKD domain
LKTSVGKDTVTLAMRQWGLVLSACIACSCVGKFSATFVAKENGGGSGGSTPTGGSSAASGGTSTGGTTGSGGATSTGGSGVSLTCGDGKVDTGEDCDQSQLNGKTCTSLGFNSGTLACTSNCQFNTSGCSGSLTPVITASRTTCAAPCAVFFDTTQTSGLMASDYVNAAFAWNFDTTTVDPAAAHQQAIGFSVGHVFEIPGTYQVGVTARDSAGHAGSSSVSITVSALTGATYYVASTGNDKNAGTTMAQPLASFSAALAKTAAQVSVLFRRGDTFNAGSATLVIQGTGPFLIGAYSDPASPSTVAPIISSATAGGTSGLLSVSGAKDARLVDLHFVSAGASNGIVLGGSPNTLVERVEVEGLGQGNSTVQEGEVLYTETTSVPTFFVDCHIHDFMGTGFYGQDVSHLAIIGTTIDSFGGGQHGIRVQGASFAYIANNTIASNDTSSALSGITIRGDNKNTVVANNRSNRLIEFTPQNEQAVEHVTYGLADGNIINDNREPPIYPAMNIIAQHIVIRNNILMNGPTGIALAAMPQLPANFVDQIFIYNNTFYFFPTSYSTDNGADIVSQLGTTGSMIVENNIFAEGLTTTAGVTFLNTDGKGTVTEDHNLGYDPNGKGTWKPGTGTGDVVGNPMFVSTDPTNANAFQIGAGSAAIDVGATVPVYEDFAGAPRPSGAGWDIGAFEFQSP